MRAQGSNTSWTFNGNVSELLYCFFNIIPSKGCWVDFLLETEFESGFRRLVFESESSRRALEELDRDHEQLQTDHRRVNGENKMLQRQLRTLTQRVNKYESEARILASHVGEPFILSLRS